MSPRDFNLWNKKIPGRIHEILVYQNNKKQQGCFNILVTLSFCLRDSRELCPAFTFGTHLRDSPEGHPITVSSLNEDTWEYYSFGGHNACFPAIFDWLDIQLSWSIINMYTILVNPTKNISGGFWSIDKCKERIHNIGY